MTTRIKVWLLVALFITVFAYSFAVTLWAIGL